MLAKLAAVITAAEFVVATMFYFRRRARPRATWMMGGVLLIALGLHAFFLVVAHDTPPLQLAVALALFGVSNVLFWSAVVAHGTKRPSAVFGETTPEALVTSGPYRVVRHPFYLAYVSAFLGSALVGNHWILLIATAVLFACYDWAARSEEYLLASDPGPCGSQYAAYLRKSWRWLPFVF
jgi:protein-S-isoprenylcysteine O-methyltransferase Ste14